MIDLKFIEQFSKLSDLWFCGTESSESEDPAKHAIRRRASDAGRAGGSRFIEPVRIRRKLHVPNPVAANQPESGDANAATESGRVRKDDPGKSSSAVWFDLLKGTNAQAEIPAATTRRPVGKRFCFGVIPTIHFILVAAPGKRNNYVN
jgi:hypothetical protein